jgi:hypothetical protein
MGSERDSDMDMATFHTHIHACTYTYMHTYIFAGRVYTLTGARFDSFTTGHRDGHSDVAYTYTCMHVYIYACTHIRRTGIHADRGEIQLFHYWAARGHFGEPQTDIHTCTYTYMHTYIHIFRTGIHADRSEIRLFHYWAARGHFGQPQTDLKTLQKTEDDFLIFPIARALQECPLVNFSRQVDIEEDLRAILA